ncbi:DUF4857 domain-containing protein [Chrysiogenes arsenatis]|uniref:DUF4857 domain-containing protein n=1 Tax=Chrysiogenes arsenatis TaxID=309797 RepID=UPI0003F8E5C8|nr:DUF4857 domain-containing protein [Chrysiogenes arsenatis]
MIAMGIRYITVLIALVGLSITLPHLFHLTFGQKVYRPMVYYSQILEDVVYSVEDISGHRRYFDATGKEYSAHEYSQLIPFINFRDLEKWEIYPQQVAGEPVTIELALTQRDFVGIPHGFFARQQARIPLYPLFESQGEFARIDMPDELFRSTDQLEFIDARTNLVNRAKSALFTAALHDAGFRFPARLIAGNPTVRKPYDAGYFLIDANGSLFHLVQVNGTPTVVSVPISIGMDIIYMTQKENRHLPYYGLIVTRQGKMFHLMKEKYTLREVPSVPYDPNRHMLHYLRDPQNMVAKVSDRYGETTVVSDNHYAQLMSYFHPYEPAIRGSASWLYGALFPFVTHTDPLRRFGQLPAVSLSETVPRALGVGMVLALGFLVLRRAQCKERYLYGEMLLIVCCGLYAFIPLLALPAIRRGEI